VKGQNRWPVEEVTGEGAEQVFGEMEKAIDTRGEAERVGGGCRWRR
jgi:hypothetical protein